MEWAMVNDCKICGLSSKNKLLVSRKASGLALTSEALASCGVSGSIPLLAKEQGATDSRMAHQG